MDDISFSEYFEYHSEGFLTWKIKPRRGKHIGDVVGSNCGKYLGTKIKGKGYYIHVIVWVMHNGPIPKGYQIDHLDHNRYNNRIENLRLVTNQENHRNMPIRKDNCSGYTGVRWVIERGKWSATICIDGKTKHLGLFRDKDDAIAARQEAEIKYGFHPNHGRGGVDHENQVL
ncbi:HNH endonuclease signature motif containing protein [Escherichia coli]|nr:HNH endonuclease [Escherichia coli]EKM2404021.1 HNH endonuclease [Escherichia coli]EKR0322627.1 HNH endonuclease [Escherichia coli]